MYEDANFKETRVYTGGTFDLLHPGHIDFLKECSKFGKVYVSLNTDEFIERYKGKKPILTFTERETVLNAIKYVHRVIPNEGEEDSKIAIQKVKPDFIIIGSDWLQRDYCKQMNFDEKFLVDNSISLIYLPRKRDISTTKIKGMVHES